MTCHHSGAYDAHVIVCTPDTFVSLESFGAKVWCEYHSYLGPTFYRSEKAIVPISVPSRKTWDAFQRWRDSLGPDHK